MEFNLLSVMRLAGGLALFIFGMMTMGGALERVAGSKLEKTLEKMTGNVIKALCMGAAVTAVIQSSSATTVMVVGFVNAGIMTLQQSVGVILGANIGTTVTSQLLRLDSTGAVSGSIFLQVIKPANLAYVIVAAGLLTGMLAKKKRTRDIGDILIGFGILFIGMSTMEGAMSPLKDMPAFQNLFVMFTNPIMGVLVGMLVTAVIQSSSASVGILQALSTTGMIPYSAAIPIIMGQNIGTCVTALLSAAGANKNARRAAMIHFYFNLLGSSIFLAVVYTAKLFLVFPFWNEAIDKGGIANLHLLFNVSATLLFLPFTKQLVRLAEKTIPEDETKIDPLSRLEPRFYQTPSVALEQSHNCITDMGKVALENFKAAIAPIFADNKNLDSKSFEEREKFLDRAEVEIGKYLMGLPSALPQGSRHLHAEMLHSLSDFEKIGDYAKNIFDSIRDFKESGSVFSQDAIEDLRMMSDAVTEILNLTLDGYAFRQSASAREALPLEEIIDVLKEELKNRHIERLGNNTCTVQTGVTFLEVIHDLEKIADHCSNIAIYTIQLTEGASRFDTHNFKAEDFPGYSEKMEFFKAKYLAGIFG